MDQPKAATEATLRFNEAFAKSLPHDTREDFENAERGFIATIPYAALTPQDLVCYQHHGLISCGIWPVYALPQMRMSGR